MRGHIARSRQSHPLRQMRPRAVGLTDNQEVFGSMPDSPEHLNLVTRTRMERIVDASQFDELFAGSM